MLYASCFMTAMHIKSIRLKNFKKFSQEEGFEVKFPSDFSVVRAPNESGKSTIVSAITAGLFLNPKTAKAKSFQSWQSEKLPEITVVFEERGETFELVKNFEMKDTSLTNLDTKEKITNFEQIQKKINEIFGFSNEDIFRGIFSVDQNAFYKLDEHEVTLQESLENLVTGAGQRTASEIVASFEKEISAITKQSLKNPGHLQRIKGELSRIDQVLADFDSRAERFNNLTQELSVKSVQLGIIDKDFYGKRQQIQFSKESIILNKDLERIEGNLEKLEKTRKDLDAVNDKLRNFEEFKDIDVDKLKDRIKDLNNKVNFKKRSEESAISKFVRGNYSLLKYIFGGLILASLGLSMWNLSLIISAPIFAVLFGIVAYFHNKISNTYQLILASKDLEAILKKFNARDEETLYARINEVRGLFWEKSKLDHTFTTFGGDGAFTKQKDERKRIMRSSDALKSRAEDYNVEILEDEQILKKLTKDADVMERNRDELKDAVAKIQGELKGLNFSEEEKIKMEEMKASFSEQLDYWQKKLKILETAKELLVEAREKTLIGLKDKLSDYVSGFLSVISGGKYKKIIIDQNFAFKVFSDEKGSEIVPEDDLSRGTIDQFYLMVRFAFAKILSKNKRSFMVLDDPFHNFDADRKMRAKKLLQDLTEEFQVILFTHSKEYDDWGEVAEI